MRNNGNISELYEQVKQNSLNRVIQNIVEKLGKNADMGDYIDDFAKSDAPQFKGASKEKRRDMAIAAFLDQKDKKEGFASDAQRRAAFAQGYKAKGKKGKKEETELDEAKYQVNYSKGGKLFSKTVNAKNEDDAEDKAIKQFKIEDDDIRSVVKEEIDIQEDGHVDVASAVRQCKTITEDAMQMLQKLQTMSPEDALPTWWTNKLAVASNNMNKMRDYLLVPSVSEEVELNEAEVSVFGFISTGARKKFLDDLKSMRLQFKSKVMNLPVPAPPSGVLKFDANQSTIEAIIKFAKRRKLKIIKEEVELEEDMAPDVIERDAKKAMSQFNSDMAKIYPSSKYFARATTAPMGGGIAFEFAVIPTSQAKGVDLRNAPAHSKFMMHLTDGFGKKVPLSKVSIQQIMGRLPTKFRKITARTPTDAVSKMVDFFKKNKSDFESLVKEEVELDEAKSQGMFIVLEKGSKNKVIGQFRDKKKDIDMMKNNAG